MRESCGQDGAVHVARVGPDSRMADNRPHVVDHAAAVVLILDLKTIAIMLIGALGFLACRRLPGLPSRAVTAFAISCWGLRRCSRVAGETPHGGVIGLGYQAFSARTSERIHRQVRQSRALRAHGDFVWPAVVALERAGWKKSALALPWCIALAVAVMHSLSAKMALIVGISGRSMSCACFRRRGRCLHLSSRRFSSRHGRFCSTFCVRTPVFAAPAFTAELPDTLAGARQHLAFMSPARYRRAAMVRLGHGSVPRHSRRSRHLRSGMGASAAASAQQRF